MTNFLEGGVIGRIILWFVAVFKTSYEHSRVRKFALRLKAIACGSKTAEWLSRYVNKKPYFSTSVCFRITRAIVGFIDKIMNILHNFFAKIIYASKSKEKYCSLKELEANEKIWSVALFITSLCIGYVGVKVITGGMDFISLVALWAIFILCAFVMFFSANPEIAANSQIVRLLRFFLCSDKENCNE